MIEFIDNILLVNQQHSMQRKCARVSIMYTNISKWCMTCTLNVYSLVHQAWALSSFPRSFQCCASSLYKIALNLFSCVPNIVPKLSFLAVHTSISWLYIDGSDIIVVTEHWLWPYEAKRLSEVHPDLGCISCVPTRVWMLTAVPYLNSLYSRAQVMVLS